MLVCSLQIMLRHDSCSLLIGWPSNVDGTDDGALSPVPSPSPQTGSYQSHGRRICSVQTEVSQLKPQLVCNRKAVQFWFTPLYCTSTLPDLIFRWNLASQSSLSAWSISDERYIQPLCSKDNLSKYTLSNSSSSSQADELLSEDRK